jgi:hypothetical protein
VGLDGRNSAFAASALRESDGVGEVGSTVAVMRAVDRP